MKETIPVAPLTLAFLPLEEGNELLFQPPSLWRWQPQRLIQSLFHRSAPCSRPRARQAPRPCLWTG